MQGSLHILVTWFLERSYQIPSMFIHKTKSGILGQYQMIGTQLRQLLPTCNLFFWFWKLFSKREKIPQFYSCSKCQGGPS